MQPQTFLSDALLFNGDYFSSIGFEKMRTYEEVEHYIYLLRRAYAGATDGVLLHLVLRQNGLTEKEMYLQDERIQKLLKLEEQQQWLKIKLYFPPDYPKGLCHEP